MKPFDPEKYMDEAAALIDLSLPPDSRAAVAANLLRLRSFAEDILAFNTPCETSPQDAPIE